MTVGDLDRYLRNLADAIGKAKGVTDGLTATADALLPFGDMQLPAFAAFLRDAKQYKETGILPAAPVKGGKKAAAKPAAAPKPDPKTLLELVKDLHARALSDPTITREVVERQVNAFEKLTALALTDILKQLDYKNIPKTKPDMLKALTQHVMQRVGSYQRADA